jgi:hypothetical protein
MSSWNNPKPFARPEYTVVACVDGTTQHIWHIAPPTGGDVFKIGTCKRCKINDVFRVSFPSVANRELHHEEREEARRALLGT